MSKAGLPGAGTEGPGPERIARGIRHTCGMNEELRRRVAAARVARLGTAEEAGRIHLVPICFALTGDTVYGAVDGKPKRSRELRRLRNVRARPWATVLVDHYEEDWSRLWWVRISGAARVLDVAGDEEARAIALLVAKYPQYQREPPAGPVMAVEITRWRHWSAQEW